MYMPSSVSMLVTDLQAYPPEVEKEPLIFLLFRLGLAGTSAAAADTSYTLRRSISEESSNVLGLCATAKVHVTPSCHCIGDWSSNVRSLPLQSIEMPSNMLPLLPESRCIQ